MVSRQVGKQQMACHAMPGLLVGVKHAPTRHASAPCSHLWVQLQRHVQQQHVVLGDGAVVHHDGLRGRGSGRPGRLVRSGRGVSMRVASVCRQFAIALDLGVQAAGGGLVPKQGMDANRSRPAVPARRTASRPDTLPQRPLAHRLERHGEVAHDTALGVQPPVPA